MKVLWVALCRVSRTLPRRSSGSCQSSPIDPSRLSQASALPQAPLWIASEANYFSEAGLRVETLFIQNSSTVIQSLLVG